MRKLIGNLRRGDNLVADSYYCTYWLLAACRAKGVAVVMKNHHKRDNCQLAPNRTSDWRFKQGQLIPPPRSSSDGPLLQRRSEHSGITWRIDRRWISLWLSATYTRPDTPIGGSREPWASPAERFKDTRRLKNQTGPKRQRLQRPKRQRPATIQTGPKRQPGPATSTANRRPLHAASANPFERPFFKRSTPGCQPNGSTKISSPTTASPASTGRSTDLSKP